MATGQLSDGEGRHPLRLVSLAFLGVLALAAVLFLGGSGAWAEDEEEEEPPRREEEEPELEGEAKRIHEAEVKRLLKYLHTEKNRMVALGKIEELGVQASRASRDTLMKFVIGNKNQAFIHASFYALAKIGGKKVIEFLAGKYGLRSRDFLVQHSAVGALEEAADLRVVGDLIEVMTNRRTKIKVVGACANAISKLSPMDERVVAVLFEYAEHRKDTIRAYAIEALGRLGTDAALERLVDALFHDKNTRVRGAAATGLGHTGRSDALPHLRKALAESNAHTVRDACMEAIKELQ